MILLMFGVGLHFHLKDLLAVRKVAIPGALVQIAVATAWALVTRCSDGPGPRELSLAWRFQSPARW